jgi:glyoxylase-like metal-dependent hydrolase (beta-lactamase superfamily II)
VVIDPGGDVANIRNAIEQTGMTPTGIWLTHGHIDHAGGVAELNEHLKVPVTGPHEDDAFLLGGLAEQGREYGFAARNCTPDRWLDEGDTVKVGEVEFAVRHCPGHSPGHVVFLNEALKFGHVGDVLFQGSIGRTDFEYGDHDALISRSRPSCCRCRTISRSSAAMARRARSGRSGRVIRSFADARNDCLAFANTSVSAPVHGPANLLGPLRGL